jgi:hypothetical protein
MKVYYAVITDNNNNPVLELQYTASARHAAFLGQQYVNSVPPAQGFKVRMLVLDAKQIVRLLNQGSLTKWQNIS